MKTKLLFSKYEIAQFLPIAVFAVIVMIMFAALLIDGGFLLSNRRTAQAAADAGALAGAKLLCETNPSVDVQAQAKAQAEYMVEKDGAELASEPEINGPTITVVATVQMNSFFARIFNQINLISNAKAVAGCYPMGAAQVLPIGWSCKNAVGEMSNLQTCQQNLLDWTTEMKPLITGFMNEMQYDDVTIHGYDSPVSIPMDFSKNMLDKNMYVVMDNKKLQDDINCDDPTKDPPPGGLSVDCDLDNDNVNEILGNEGDRSWLDLDLVKSGNEGTNQLIQWINGTDIPTLAKHSWLGTQSGTGQNVFQAVKQHTGEVVLVPVFDALCDVYPTSSDCEGDVHTMEGYKGPGDIITSNDNALNYLHITGFSAFYIACVDTAGEGGGNQKNQCPGAIQFICSNINNEPPTWPDHNAVCINGVITHNNSWIKSIEGYFVKNYISVGNPGTGDYDLDPLVISLIQ